MGQFTCSKVGKDWAEFKNHAENTGLNNVCMSPPLEYNFLVICKRVSTSYVHYHYHLQTSVRSCFHMLLISITTCCSLITLHSLWDKTVYLSYFYALLLACSRFFLFQFIITKTPWNKVKLREKEWLTVVQQANQTTLALSAQSGSTANIYHTPKPEISIVLKSMRFCSLMAERPWTIWLPVCRNVNQRQLILLLFVPFFYRAISA